MATLIMLIVTIAKETQFLIKGSKSYISYGPSRNIEAYHYKNGSGGRHKPDLCIVVIRYSNFMLKYCCDNQECTHHNMTQVAFTFAF